MKFILFVEGHTDKLNPEIVYEKCPKFKKLMDTMLDLAKSVKHEKNI